MAFHAHALQIVQVMLKSFSNEGHFTLEDLTLFLLYLSSCSSWVTVMCNLALPVPSLQAVQVRLKSVSNEGHFTLEAETVFRLYLPSNCCGVTDFRHKQALRKSYKQSKIGSSRSVMKGTLLLWPKQFFFCMSRRIAVGLLIYDIWHCQRMRYMQGKLGSRRSVMKGTLLLRTKQFLVRISIRVAVG
jgi:hypothetical protein